MSVTKFAIIIYASPLSSDLLFESPDICLCLRLLLSSWIAWKLTLMHGSLNSESEGRRRRGRSARVLSNSTIRSITSIRQESIRTLCRILKLWNGEAQGGAVSVSFLISAGCVYKLFGLSLIMDPIANKISFIHRSASVQRIQQEGYGQGHPIHPYSP